MKKRTGAHSAMAELLSKSNEAQIKDIKAVSAPVRKPAPAKNPSIIRDKNEVNTKAVNGAVRPAPNKINKPSGVAPSAAKPMANTAPKPIVTNRAPVQSRTPAPVNKKAKRTKSFNFKPVIKIASFVAVVLVAVAVIAAIISGVTALSKAAVVPEAYIGGDLQVGEAVKVLSIGDPDATKHDGRNYITIDFFEGEEIVCSTGASTVGDVLESMNVKIEGDYVLRENEADTITADAVINVDKVTYGTVTEEAAVPFETRYVDVQTIARGKTKVTTAGKNGVSTATFKVTYVNGVESERVMMSEVVTTKPTTQVVSRGVGGTINIGGKTYSYSYYIDCETTVYTGGGITASGLPATEKVIAVDPRVIPLGTQVYVSDPYCYVGIRTAADTGGSIKGNIIDIYFDESNPSLWGYGRRHARVYILD